MGVISSPLRLKMAALALALCALLAALQVAIHAGTPWWKLPLARMGLFSAGAAAVLVPLSWLMVRGNLRAARAVHSVLAAWAIFSGLVALAGGSVPLGFFAIFQILVFGGLSLWVETELSRSFVNPGMRWYQGLPAPIPSLQCEIQGERADSRREFRVARMDREGAYVFQRADGMLDLRRRGPREMVFRLRDHEIRCVGVPVGYFDRGSSTGAGVGFRFSGMTADRRKDLGDFIEALQGEGYVQ